MSAQEKSRASGYKRKISLKKIKNSIHVPEEKLRSSLESRSLRKEQIDFLCDLLRIDVDRNKKQNDINYLDDCFMRGKIFC
jgi:CRISPR/Cas system-associated protein Csx1